MKKNNSLDKPKFNKDKCVKCKYHGLNVGYTADVKGQKRLVYCNYSATGNTCLKRVGEDKIKDLRGTRFNDCKLFEEGEMIEEGEF